MELLRDSSIATAKSVETLVAAKAQKSFEGAIDQTLCAHAPVQHVLCSMSRQERDTQPREIEMSQSVGVVSPICTEEIAIPPRFQRNVCLPPQFEC